MNRAHWMLPALALLACNNGSTAASPDPGDADVTDATQDTQDADAETDASAIPDAYVPDGEPICDRPATFERSPGEALEGSGWHRIYIQGLSAIPADDGSYGMSERRNDVNTGDHFLLSQGALVEWTYPVTGALTGHAFMHIARVDDADVVARYELFLVRGGEPALMVRVDDRSTGTMGYTPFEGCFYGGRGTSRPTGDAYLLLRVTNLTGGMLGVVARSPDYFTWVDIEVE